MKTAGGGFCCVVNIYLALLKNIKDNKYKSKLKSNHTRVFNITFIGFLIIQLKFITNKIKKLRF